MKHLIFLLLVIALGAEAHAALNKETMAELLKVADGQAVLDLMAQKIDAQMEDQFDRAITNRETPGGLAYAESFRQKVQARFKETITLPNLAGDCIVDSDEELTQAEADALIAFCANPVGKSALGKLSPMMHHFQSVAQKRVVQFRMAPEQSMATAMKELKEITFKSLGVPAPANEAKAPATQPFATPLAPAHP